MDKDNVGERLASIEAKIDMLLERERDLRTLERKQWYHTGGLAVIAFLAMKLGFIKLH